MHPLIEAVVARNQATVDRLDKARCAIQQLIDMTAKRVSLKPLFQGEGFIFWSVYEGPHCNVVIGRFERGAVALPHFHPESAQHIIVSFGVIEINIDGRVERLFCGDSTVIKPNVMHSFVALSALTQVISVCVPPEKAFT